METRESIRCLEIARIRVIIFLIDVPHFLLFFVLSIDDMNIETACPPYYAEPTHAKTLLFSTDSYARNINDWYQCIEGAYCNAPSFLGYNPPGEGKIWTTAWKVVDPYPCNSALEVSSDGRVDATNNRPNTPSSPASYVVTPRPTSQPTTEAEQPSLISGAIWYDHNGDGRSNTALNALSQTDYVAATKERGAGISNMRVTLRDCNTNKLLGVTYTFPRSFGSGGEGGIEVVDSSYIETVQMQQVENSGYSNLANDGLGIGNTEGRLGYYSFRILPFQIPGEFYVVFESPEGYRLSGGSGDYWEVYKHALNDNVQPVMEAFWEGAENRRLQLDVGSAFNDTTTSVQTAESAQYDNTPGNMRPAKPKDPINYSGYYATSKCLTLNKSPTRITRIDAGLSEDPWPILPFQYASLVVTIRFYAPIGRKRRYERKLQNVLSLECRRYEKLKSEGIEVEDIWGCETGGSTGSGVQIVDFKELTLPEGDLVATSIKDFLTNRVGRAWTIKSVSIAQNVKSSP